MARNGAPVDPCAWCGEAHDSESCPLHGADEGRVFGSTTAGDVYRLTEAERRTVYGMVAALPRRRSRNGFDEEIPPHKRILICGVAPDTLERACDPGPGGGVDEPTIKRLRKHLGRLARRP